MACITWIQTHHGHRFEYQNTDPRHFFIGDIAHSLSLLCRFNGHTKKFYSVAEHSVWVSHMVSPENALAALMHDAAEAYISDVPSPLKRLLGKTGQELKNKELEYQRLMGERFGYDPYMNGEITQADLEMLLIEKQQAMLHALEWGWERDFEFILHDRLPYNIELAFWSPDESSERFLRRFRYLTQRGS